MDVAVRRGRRRDWGRESQSWLSEAEEVVNTGMTELHNSRSGRWRLLTGGERNSPPHSVRSPCQSGWALGMFDFAIRPDAITVNELSFIGVWTTAGKHWKAPIEDVADLRNESKNCTDEPISSRPNTGIQHQYFASGFSFSSRLPLANFARTQDKEENPDFSN